MIKSKKLIAAAAVALIASLSFAQEVSFSNKLKSNIADITITDDGTSTSLAAFSNKASAEYNSEKLDAGAAINFKVALKDDIFAFGSENFIDDAFIEFRPTEILGIGFNRGYYVAGSYLPCLEDDMAESNIGSNFGLFIRPVEGLVIAGGLDFVSYFVNTEEKPLINFGAEYAACEAFTFGAAARNIIADSRTLGIYASFKGVEGLTLNAGFTYNGNLKDYRLTGNLINAALMLNKGPFGFYANAVVSLGGDADNDNELYTAATMTYMISNSLIANIYGGFSTDFDNDAARAAEVSSGICAFLNKNNSVKASVFVYLINGMTNISFPFYWKYTF